VSAVKWKSRSVAAEKLRGDREEALRAHRVTCRRICTEKLDERAALRPPGIVLAPSRFALLVIVALQVQRSDPV
jgi:hypothetical protein